MTHERKQAHTYCNVCTIKHIILSTFYVLCNGLFESFRRFFAWRPTLEFVFQIKFMCILHSRRGVDPSRVGALSISVAFDVPYVVVVRRTFCCTRVRRWTCPSARMLSDVFDSHVNDPHTFRTLSFVCPPQTVKFCFHSMAYLSAKWLDTKLTTVSAYKKLCHIICS